MLKIPYFKGINEFIMFENGEDLLIEKVSRQEIRFRFSEATIFRKLAVCKKHLKTAAA